MAPKLIITRPVAPGRAFADSIAVSLGRDIAVIASPAFEITPVDADLPPADHIILTSANGAAQLQRLGVAAGTTAWCVGDRTAQAAQAAGMKAISARGDADALVATIAKARPEGRMVHLAGKHTRGAVCERLQALGLICQQVTTYAQKPCEPTDALIAALAGNDPLVSPVFSPRSAAPLALPDRRAPLHGIAISPAVAAVLEGLHLDTCVTARSPDEEAMHDATCDVMRDLFDRG